MKDKDRIKQLEKQIVEDKLRREQEIQACKKIASIKWAIS